MNRRTVGLGMMGLGVLVVVVSLIGLVLQRSNRADPVADSTTTTTAAPATGSQSSTSSSTVTTTSEPTTTTTLGSTTTTIVRVDEAALVADFIDMYRIAIQLANVDFLFDRLHPEVVALSTPELCRAFIEREILELLEYTATGPVDGPEVRELGSGLESVWTVPVSFVFQGTAFDATASFAVVDGEVRWFTECRAET